MRFILCVLLMGTILPVLRADENWNQFRGPRGDGSSTSTRLPVRFSDDSPEVAWKVAVPGRAWSSPVVWNQHIWLTNSPEIHNLPDGQKKLAEPLKFTALCFDLETGKLVREVMIFEVDEPQYTHDTNSYGSSTPYIEEGRIYIHFGTYGTACVDTQTGNKIWERRDLRCNHFRGPGSSVAVYGDLVYLTLDGYDLQYIAALDKHTGKTVWKKDREIDARTTDGDAKKAYSTPLLVHADGRDMLISPYAGATIAYHPQTGEQLWIVRHGGVNAAGRPIYANGLVYINSADGPNPLIAVKPVGTGDISERIVWRSNKSIPKRPSQVLVGDLMFMMNDGGVASCLNAMTGEVIWSKRLEGEYWSSPLTANGLVYCFSQTGQIYVFKAARTLEIVAENKLGSGFIASPAVAGDALILRSKTHLYRIANPSAAAGAK